MKIDPQNLTLSELLYGRLFTIPAYQRPYSWQDKQRNELFNDLISLHTKQQDFHFMATVVAVSQGRKTLGTDEYQVMDVVDGQQRLTTLILLLRAISLALPEGDPERSKLEGQLVMPDDHTLVLLQTNHDYAGYFIRYMRHGEKPQSEHFSSAADANLVAGIRSAEGFVRHWQEETNQPLQVLLAILKNRLRFIFHALEDERMVYTVFEVLNTRGLPVAWLDRAKAVLMGIAYEEAQNQQAMINELHAIWQRIYEKVGLRQGLSSEALRFAATLWSSAEASKVLSDSDALEVFRSSAMDDPNNTIEISAFIERVAGALDKLLEDTQKAAVTKIAHARLLAIAIELTFAGENRVRLLTQWEHSSFRIFGLGRRDSRSSIGDYVRLAHRVYRSDNNDADYRSSMHQIKALAQGKFSASTVVDNLRNTDCYDGWEESLRYFFFARERWLDQNSDRPLLSADWHKIWQQSASRTVEHIFPQTPEADSGWRTMLEEADISTAEAVCHRLGNLVLLPKPMNSQASNAEFTVKRETYRTTGLMITDEIAALDSWTLDSIAERENELIAWAAEYWDDVQA